MKKVDSVPLFALSSHEKAVYRVLGGGPLRVSDIVRQSGVPETSVGRALLLLCRRGLVRGVPGGASIGRRRRYVRTSLSLVQKYFSDAQRELGLETPADAEKKIKKQKEKEKDMLGKTLRTPSATIEVVEGLPAIYAVITEAFSGKESERTYLTQLPSAIMSQKVETSLEMIEHMNKTAAQHGGILEVFMTRDTMRSYAQIARNDSWVESQKDRKIGANVLPDGVLPPIRSEVFVFRDTVMLTDWVGESAVLLHSHDLSALLISLFTTVGPLGESFDAHSFVQAVLEQTHTENKK